MKRTAVFDISTSGGLRDLDELKNKCGIRILNEKEYFGIGGSEDGPVTMLFRSIDYEERECNALIDDAVYKMPLC